MDVPDRVGQAVLAALMGEALEMARVVVDLAWDDVEIEPLSLPRRVVHEEVQAFLAAVAQPLVDGQAIALGLGDLLAALVEEQLVVEAHGRAGAEDAADGARVLGRVDQVLARHLVVDVERRPAHGPVGLPAQLALATGHRHFRLRAILVLEHHGAIGGAGLDQRHLEHVSGGRADRQDRAEGGASLGPQRRQHERHDGVEIGEHRAQGLVEQAGPVARGRALELVVEAEAVEEGLEPGVVVVAKALMGPEGVGHLGQRLAEVLGEHLLVGQVGGHGAQPVHVVGEGKQPRRRVRQQGEGVAHHGGPGDFAEGADMGQAAGPVAGLEQHVALGGRLAPGALENLARLLERPGIAGQRELAVIAHDCILFPKRRGPWAKARASVNWPSIGSDTCRNSFSR